MAIIGSLASGGMKPTTPTIGTASDGGTGTSASVAFTPSSYIGKGTITYTATSSPGSLTGTGSSSPITVSGLTTGTAYTFTVSGTTNYGVASASSAASNSVTPASPSSFESIATVTATGSQTSINFTSIPSTYTHLQIRIIARQSSGTLTQPALKMRFNGDSTGANYTYHILSGNGTAASSSGFTDMGEIQLNGFAGNSSGADMFGVGVTDIVDYASTNKYKTIRTFGGTDQNGSGLSQLISNAWLQTTAISSIEIYGSQTNSFATGSVFALYGIKGA